MELITFHHDAETFHSRVGVWTFIVAVTTVQSIAKELRIRPLVLWTSVADSVSPADTKSQRVSFKTTGGG